MCTVVIRSKNKHTKGLFSLSDDARRRAREHLKSVGYDVDGIQPLIWPDDAVEASRKHIYAPWEFVTKADVRRSRQERMKRILWWKREYGVVRRRALYVWVFRCPGWVYEGWYTYLIGTNISCALNFRGNNESLIARLMELFPLVGPTRLLFEDRSGGPAASAPASSFRRQERGGLPDLDKWMAEFVKRYQRGTWCGRPQGKSPVWAEVEGTHIKRIIGRAEWR
jgi:hypothetical protein